MDGKLRAFRKRAQAENRGRTGLSRRYSRELRRDAVAYLKRQKVEGSTHERVASELGIANWTLSRWVREAEKRSVVVAVEVTETEESATATLLTPHGYRIEGLTEEGLVRLVERLG